MKQCITYMTQLLCTCLLMIAAITLHSCKKFVSVPPPPDLIVANEVFTSEAKASSVVSSIYGSLINGSASFSNGLTTVYGGYSADEILRFNPPPTQQEFMTNSLTPANAQVRNLWNSLYRHIYYCNAAIEGLLNAAAVSPSVKDKLIAECRFIRAFCYFYLVNLWGDVPLALTSSYHTNAILPRKPSADVYAVIQSELLETKAALPPTSPTDKSRPTKAAASALLARVYLYQKQWDKAESEATAVLATGFFTPLPPVNQVFTASSKESIWQLVPNSGFLKETAEMRPIAGAPQNYITQHLLSAFEPADQRRLRWIDSITHQTVKYFYPAKYRNTAATVTEHYVVLRAAEQLMIRAEARLQQNNTNGAIADINIIRQRAGLAPLPASAPATIVAAALEKESRIEFFAEWAHRWLNLKRWNKTIDVLTPNKPSFQAYAQWYPIPSDDIISNPFLSQNPGY